MDDLSRGLREKSYAKGHAEGRTETIIESLKKLMKNMGLSADRAMALIGVPETEWQEYAELLKESAE